MRHSMEKDLARRRLYARYELWRVLYGALLRDETLPARLRYQLQQALQALPGNSSAVRQRNRCMLTGRPRSVLRRFRLSRLMVRRLAREGMLMGVTKASW